VRVRGINVIRLDIEIWEIEKGGTKRGLRKSGVWVGEEVWELLGFVPLVCVWVYFCCSGVCFCQGFQGAMVVYS
jgi:hypothetical protein